MRVDRLSRSVAFFALWATVPLSMGSAATPEPGHKPRIGVFAFANTGGTCENKAFSDGLREQGLVTGQNIEIECQHANEHGAIDAAAADLVRRRPDIIVAFGHAPALAMRRATRDIPIVMSTSGEPVAAGLVASLARPGGNVTGVSYYNAELNAKRLELIKSVVPGVKRVALVRDPNAPPDLIEVYERHSREAAKALGLELRMVDASGGAELDARFAQMAKDGVEAVFIMPFHALFKEIPRIAQLAKRYKLPTMHCNKAFVPAGGLMFYGVDYFDQHRRMAAYVDKILRGAKPAELPVEQPARFEFHINRIAAEELGLKLSPAVLMRANKIVE